MKKTLREGTYEVHKNEWRKTDFVAYIQQRRDQPVHSCSLISIVIICSLESIIDRLATCKISIIILSAF